MKFTSYIVGLFLLLVCAGCTVEEQDYREHDYGYVQFKLYKEASSPMVKALGDDPLEYLRDATKIKVTLGYGDELIYQTLTLSAKDGEAAEFGIRSEKLKLLTGKYSLISFILYNAKDEEVYEDRKQVGTFEIVSGGLWSHELTVDVYERGQVRFSLIKEFSEVSSGPAVKSGETEASGGEYIFDEIGYVNLKVRHVSSREEEEFNMLPAKFSVHFDEDDKVSDEFGYQTSSIVCDTLLSLLGGRYELLSYTTLNKSKKQLEINPLPSKCEFVIEDNRITEVDIPVTLKMSAPYINDYIALKRIYEELDGDNWHYIGENFQKGTKWDFKKDIDLWGDQPGVQLHANGRVALLDLSNFGFHGEMPDELGDLTELVELYLGTHNDTNIYTDIPGAGSSDAERKARAREYLRRTHPPVQFSEPIARAMMEKGVSIPEIEMYEKYAEKDIIDKRDGQMIIRPLDTNPGTIVNGLTKLPESIGNLKKLQKLCIANSTLAKLPDAFAQLESCTDLELYNLPDMKEFPDVVAHMPALVQVNLSSNPQWGELRSGYTRCDGQPGTQSDYGLHILAHKDEEVDTDGKYRAYKTIQMIYMNDCGLTEVTNNISNLKSLGMLSLSYNQIDKIYPFGSDIVMVQLYLDHNKLTSIPVDSVEGVFCGMDEVETLSFSHNLLEELPDIFTSKSHFIMKSVDFSYNNIMKVQNGDMYKGINVETLTMTNNPIEVFPVEFAKSKSSVAFFNLRGCRLHTIPKKAFEFEKESSSFLMSLDLSYNDLSDLPESFNATNLPYLYGLELSYNEFSKFPYEPLDCSGLTVFGIRGQRNKAGEKCLSEWPTNIRQHTGLRGFYIGSNNLGKIDDTLSPICYYLEVSDNPDIVLDASSVCYEWSNGMYYLICDKDQDIRGCDVMMQ